MIDLKIYFDMDGTLAEWQWVGPDVYSAPGYSRGLKALENVIQSVKILSETRGVTTYTLGAVLNDSHSVGDKNWWLDKNIGEIIPAERRIFVPYGANKYSFIKPTGADVLIDDWNGNLMEWPGIAIKIANGLNNSSGRWRGYTVDYRSSGEAIAKTILGIARAELEPAA